jgi:hypothetical protein
LAHATDSVQVIDVFRGDGGLSESIALPPNRRVIGFGASSLYLVYGDANDLEFVVRYFRRWS